MPLFEKPKKQNLEDKKAPRKVSFREEKKTVNVKNPRNSNENEKTKKVSFIKPEKNWNLQLPGKNKDQEILALASCLITTSPKLRISGGANNPNVRKSGKLPRTESECQFKAPGINFLSHKGGCLFSSYEVKIITQKSFEKELRHKCDFFPKFVDKKPNKDQITQTLYRESSAQTLAYLPEVFNKSKVKAVEVSSLPSVLPGTKPPDLYDVEVLERARKRWRFREALKANFKTLIVDAKEKARKSQYKSILEAFEWEHWLQREEDIQECQMMRLDIVIKMFDKREMEMHATSKTRLEKACAEIAKRRQEGLRKNEKEYQRGIRRLQTMRTRYTQKGRTQSPLESLGSPCSEFYAPLLRHGLDSARRSFVPKTNNKTFDMRIDELDKKVDTTGLSGLKCPYRRLKDISKPGQKLNEYEQNFRNERRLQKLFETLKTLRTQASKEKEPPKCVKRRRRIEYDRASVLSNQSNVGPFRKRKSSHVVEKQAPAIKQDSCHYVHIPDFHPSNEERFRDFLENEMNNKEGLLIGGVMQFLYEELDRLSEQRKLHLISILAQMERWRREASEAGLRQKEEDLRFLYEEMFPKCHVIDHRISQEFLQKILKVDVPDIAENQAIETVTQLAKQIDNDIERWLDSFKLIQNPLTYVPLRLMLKDMVCPTVDAALRRHESVMCVQHVIEDVVFPRVWNELDPFDIGTTLTSDLIDRLIDNDLYLFSTDSESETPQKMSWKESHAIIRKVIRQAVPGKRWKDETERIAFENCNDLFDDAIEGILYNMENPKPINPIHLKESLSQRKISLLDNIRLNEAMEVRSTGADSLPDTDIVRWHVLNLIKKMKWEDITKSLEKRDVFTLSDDESIDFDSFITSNVLNPQAPLKGNQRVDNLVIKKRDSDVPEDDILSANEKDELASLAEIETLFKALRSSGQTERQVHKNILGQIIKATQNKSRDDRQVPEAEVLDTEKQRDEMASLPETETLSKVLRNSEADRMVNTNILEEIKTSTPDESDDPKLSSAPIDMTSLAMQIINDSVTTVEFPETSHSPDQKNRTSSLTQLNSQKDKDSVHTKFINVSKSQQESLQPMGTYFAIRQTNSRQSLP